MNRGGTTGEIKEKLIDYKKKFYLNQLYQGIFTCLVWILGLFLLLNALEYLIKMGNWARAIGFWSFLLSSLTIIGFKAIIPFYKYLMSEKYLSDKEAAIQIGKFFPELGDKFLNLIALSEQKQDDSQLLLASINQKSVLIKPYAFHLAIDFKSTFLFFKRRLLPLVGTALLLALILPELFTESTARYIQYNKSFLPKAPFTFLTRTPSLLAFRNEDFAFDLSLSGQKVPSSVQILIDEQQLLMRTVGKNNYQYTFTKPEADLRFRLLAGGYFSDEYLIKVVDRPRMTGLKLLVLPPAYLKQKPFASQGTGNLQVPEGSMVTWQGTFSYSDTVALQVTRGPGRRYSFSKSGSDDFELSLRVNNDLPYEIQAINLFGLLKEKAVFQIDVVKDELPEIRMDTREDTSTFSNILISGIVEDDHGFSSLRVEYFTTNQKNQTSVVKSKVLSFDKEVTIQPFFTNLDLTELALNNGERLSYKVVVCDNDGVNGAKCAESRTMVFQKPSDQEYKELSQQSAEKLENKIELLHKKSSSIVKNLNRLEQKIKSKSELSWSDRKELSDLLEKNKQVLNELEELNELQEKLNALEKNLDSFSPDLLEKAQALQELMKQVLDPETQKLLEELQKLLEEKKEDSKVKENLDKLQKKNQNIENELDRALELYKNLQIDKKIEQTVSELRELAEEQNELRESKLDAGKSVEKQDSINSAFEDVKEKLNEIEKLNEEIEEKRPLNKLGEKAEKIKENLSRSKENLQKGQKKEGNKSQKEASDQMSDLANELETASAEQRMQMVEENIRDLQSILDNLISLSFQLEEQMKEYRSINQADPRYIALSQKQLKLSEDASMIEDSLMALAKRVFEIQSFVTREVSELKNFMEESAVSIKQRKPGNASGKQQYAMTSANNLALLLDDVLKNLQNQMNAMQSNGKCTSGNPKNKGKGKPQAMPGNLGDMQKQLNDQIEKLKGKGGSGEELSEEYAKIAAQQEQLRQALRQLEKMLKDKGKNPGSGLGDLAGQMEETEKDIVNKKITQETLLRQKEIETRLLEAEKSLKERDQSPEREAELAKMKERALPPDFEKYLKEKKRQVEQIRRVDPSLKPFYKNEVKKYFKSFIDNQDNL